MAAEVAYQYDAFLSHHSADKPLVLPIARALANQGIKVFYDDWEMPGGRPLGKQIDAGMETSRSVLVFLGPSGFGPIHRDEVDSGIDLANRQARTVMLVMLPGANAGSDGIPSSLRNRGMLRFKNMEPEDIGFREVLWKCIWSITGRKPEALDVLQRSGRLPATPESRPLSAAHAEQALLQRFDHATRFYGQVLILGRSWDKARRSDEPERLTRLLLPHVVDGPDWLERPLRPPLDDIATCAGELGGEEMVAEALQNALGSEAAWSVPLHDALGEYLKRWRGPQPEGEGQKDECSLVLISTSMGLHIEKLLVASELPFIRVVLQSLAADPRLLVHDFLDVGPSRRAQWQQRLLPEEFCASGAAATAQLGDLLPRGHGKRHVLLVKWMGSVDVPESCLLTRGQVARWTDLMGRGNSLRTYVESALSSRAVLMAGLRVLDEDFALLRNLVLDPAFRRGPLRPRLWSDPGRPVQAHTLAEHAERDHADELRRRLQSSLLGVNMLDKPLDETLGRLGQLAAVGPGR